MWERIQTLAAAVAMTALLAGPALAAESPSKRDSSGVPKGSFSGSCTCQMSGGMYLMCFCNNLEGKMFQTTLDIRNCQAPRDIKNCNGNLTCTEGASAQCPGK